MHPAQHFLTLAWGDPPPGKAVVWSYQRKATTLFSDFDKIEDFLGNRDDEDIYTGVSLVGSHFHIDGRNHNRRNRADDSVAIAGLWADIDIAGEHHTKKNLPPSIEAVQELMASWFESTLVIHTGHGLQLWWLFERPWIFHNNKEREQAQSLTRYWHGQLLGLLAPHGWTLDPVHDLARLMRLPGTFNNKGTRAPVRVLKETDVRLDKEGILERVGRMPDSGGWTGCRIMDTQHIDSNTDLALTPDAEPPREKMLVLMANSVKFRHSWDFRRTDMEDQSASGYDLSLAVFAVRAGWTDQEIADLLVMHRRHGSLSLKLRSDYYQRTISVARGL